jgi:predicted heme/steroid binding protein/uncharacterized membrane protein
MNQGEKEFTADELKQNDGRGGKRALIVYKGVVYDVTENRNWQGGMHMNRHRAGQDLTEALSAAPHGPENLERVLRAGNLKPEKANAAGPPILLQKLLALHPHPMSVHFPIALSIFTSVFAVLYLVSGHRPLEASSFHTLAAAFFMAPASMAAGFLSWSYSYGRKATPIFKAKIVLSVVLQIVITFCAVVRLMRPDILTFPLQPLGLLYLVLILALAPMVMLIGYLGGRITFPR